MDDAKRELVRGWLTKAQHDLASARKLAAGPDPLLDTAIYHCQQAAEKAVKWFLVFHDHRFDKTHDIEVLMTPAITFEAAFSSLIDAADRLSPYATVYRYPGLGREPVSSEFALALQDAEHVRAAILAALPLGVHP